MRQLEDHFLATAAADLEAAVEDLVLMAVAHACWEGGQRNAQPDSGEFRRSPVMQPGVLLRTLGQVLCVCLCINAITHATSSG